MSEILVNKFFDYLVEEKKLAQNTLDAYMQDVAQFKKYLENKNIDFIKGVNKTVIITYLLYLQGSGKANSTISRNLASLRCFFQYLLNKSYIKEDPTFNLKSSKTEKRIPDILSKEEINLLLAQINTKNLKGSRDKAMILLISTTGLKVSQMLNLNIDNIDINSSILHIEEENNRAIPIITDTLIEIVNYLDKYRMEALGTEALFINLYGDRLTRQGFWKILKQYSTKSGIKKSITPNTLRTSFASNMLSKGEDIRKVQKILGHSDLSITENYFLDEYTN